MSKTLLKIYNSNFYEFVGVNYLNFVRYGHHLRGKPPGIAKSLEQKLAEQRYKDPELYYKIDIGLPAPKLSKKKLLQERLDHVKAQRNDPKWEKLSRNLELKIDLEKTQKDWQETVGPQHIQTIAEHYGIFEHLFGDAYFKPRVPVNIFYTHNDLEYPVYYGNLIKPNYATKKPEVNFESDKNCLWTLVLTNPDGHFTENDKEYVHWFVANIPGNDLEKGETIIDYLQPFPPKGTGYHRHIFLLYQQSKKLDFTPYKKNDNGERINLNQRTFSTYDFYRKNQDFITPAGLAFFQSGWNTTLKDFYHKILNMKEPVYEYDFPGPYVKRQVWHPKRHPFNLYMDRYRDPKQINKEFLLRKLKHVHPFKVPPPIPPYPNAQNIEQDVPTWLNTEIRKTWLKWGRINEIE